MSLGAIKPDGSTGGLKLKSREKELKKVLIYGLDGSGKSTFAETYCRENGLKPIIIDIDNTNFTGDDILELNLSNDRIAFNSIKDAIIQIKTTDYDTIIIDGVSCLIELMTSKAPGLKAYKDRADRIFDILQLLYASGKNLIFIGQADMEVIYTEKTQSNKPVIKFNSIVNEKYYTYIENGQFKSEVKKFREIKKTKNENKPQLDIKKNKIGSE